MRFRLIAGIAAALLIYAGINYYIGWHGALLLGYVFDVSHKIWYWPLFWLVAFSYILARAGSRFLPASMSGFMRVIGSYWMAVMLYSILLLPLADICGLVMELCGMSKDFYVPMLGLACLLILLVLFALGSWNAWSPIVRRYELTVAKAAGPLKELRVAVASDIHLGSIVGNKHLKLLVERINELRPDLILLPGDIIDDDIEPFIRKEMAQVMKHLHSRFGTYAVLGNHEYIGGHIEEFVKQMKAIGVEVLLDRSVKIHDSFYLVGRKDRAVMRFGKGKREELQGLLEGLDPSLPLILMDHQPYELDKAQSAGIDVMLSGHTHRGQMAPNHWITRRLFELDWGYLRKDQLHAVVSSGYGTWGPPIRIASRSEIIELAITFKPL